MPPRLGSRDPGTPKAAVRPRPKKIGSSGGPRPIAVAITGGIGVGKTEMLHAFARHGAAVISSDEIVHRLLREDPRVKAAIVDRFGEGVVDAGGEIDRARVADVVFADPNELAWLERLLHPLVVACYLRWRESLADLEDPPTVCATEVPLLYEVGADEHFDVVVAVTASPDVRTSRVVEPMLDRERRLLSDREKLARADFRYVNDGTLAELDAFVSDLMAKLTDRCSGP